MERAKALEIAAELAVARAKASEDSALIAHQKLRIAKLERQIYGQRSERSSRLVEQLALTFEELEADATEDELAAERAVTKTTTVRGFTRKRAERRMHPAWAASLDYSGGRCLSRVGFSLCIRTSSIRFSVPKSVNAWMPSSRTRQTRTTPCPFQWRPSRSQFSSLPRSFATPG